MNKNTTVTELQQKALRYVLQSRWTRDLYQTKSTWYLAMDTYKKFKAPITEEMGHEDALDKLSELPEWLPKDAITVEEIRTDILRDGLPILARDITEEFLESEINLAREGWSTARGRDGLKTLGFDDLITKIFMKPDRSIKARPVLKPLVKH